MALFNRKAKAQAAIEQLVMDQDFEACGDYLRRFVEGQPSDREYLIRALAVVAVWQLR
jgi:hypothetical protein